MAVSIYNTEDIICFLSSQKEVVSPPVSKSDVIYIPKMYPVLMMMAFRCCTSQWWFIFTIARPEMQLLLRLLSLIVRKKDMFIYCY